MVAHADDFEAIKVEYAGVKPGEAQLVEEVIRALGGRGSDRGERLNANAYAQTGQRHSGKVLLPRVISAAPRKADYHQ